ncbi:uncharacterized protein LOC124434073 isoform X3 [Xenia sp. Carnegie-2017]|uniref:uncharacterized protein LOC124434073 isoform X3 n=1 Tax=Xenia sp. Carnegie-2017 TaxID=2897299 RepID=UPI001F0422D3|nr:uncharacterized protein LOC124434073 isoform X3 [Xenia sp. Carnegie-2017]
MDTVLDKVDSYTKSDYLESSDEETQINENNYILKQEEFDCNNGVEDEDVNNVIKETLALNEGDKNHESTADIFDCLMNEMEKSKLLVDKDDRNVQEKIDTMLNERNQGNLESSEMKITAQALSKGARLSAGDVLLHITNSETIDNEENGEMDEYFSKIRSTNTDDDFLEQISPPLNLVVMKSKASMARQGLMKGRRKPTVAKRRSWNTSMDDASIFTMDEPNDDCVDNEKNNIDGETSSASRTEGNEDNDLKISSSSSSEDEKETCKQCLSSGVALPGLGDALKIQMTRSELKRPTALRLAQNARDVKENEVIKEDRVETPNSKPEWMKELEEMKKKGKISTPKQLEMLPEPNSELQALFQQKKQVTLGESTYSEDFGKDDRTEDQTIDPELLEMSEKRKNADCLYRPPEHDQPRNFHGDGMNSELNQKFEKRKTTKQLDAGGKEGFKEYQRPLSYHGGNANTELSKIFEKRKTNALESSVDAGIHDSERPRSFHDGNIDSGLNSNFLIRKKLTPIKTRHIDVNDGSRPKSLHGDEMDSELSKIFEKRRNLASLPGEIVATHGDVVKSTASPVVPSHIDPELCKAFEKRRILKPLDGVHNVESPLPSFQRLQEDKGKEPQSSVAGNDINETSYIACDRFTIGNNGIEEMKATLSESDVMSVNEQGGPESYNNEEVDHLNDTENSSVLDGSITSVAPIVIGSQVYYTRVGRIPSAQSTPYSNKSDSSSCTSSRFAESQYVENHESGRQSRLHRQLHDHTKESGTYHRTGNFVASSIEVVDAMKLSSQSSKSLKSDTTNFIDHRSHEIKQGSDVEETIAKHGIEVVPHAIIPDGKTRDYHKTRDTRTVSHSSHMTSVNTLPPLIHPSQDVDPLLKANSNKFESDKRITLEQLHNVDSSSQYEKATLLSVAISDPLQQVNMQEAKGTLPQAVTVREVMSPVREVEFEWKNVKRNANNPSMKEFVQTYVDGSSNDLGDRDNDVRERVRVVEPESYVKSRSNGDATNVHYNSKSIVSSDDLVTLRRKTKSGRVVSRRPFSENYTDVRFQSSYNEEGMMKFQRSESLRNRRSEGFMTSSDDRIVRQNDGGDVGESRDYREKHNSNITSDINGQHSSERLERKKVDKVLDVTESRSRYDWNEANEEMVELSDYRTCRRDGVLREMSRDVCLISPDMNDIHNQRWHYKDQKIIYKNEQKTSKAIPNGLQNDKNYENRALGMNALSSRAQETSNLFAHASSTVTAWTGAYFSPLIGGKYVTNDSECIVNEKEGNRELLGGGEGRHSSPDVQSSNKM